MESSMILNYYFGSEKADILYAYKVSYIFLKIHILCLHILIRRANDISDFFQEIYYIYYLSLNTQKNTNKIFPAFSSKFFL
jgi:hypothetical protein